MTLSAPVKGHFKACHCCGLVHQMPRLERGTVARCTRCATTIHRHRGERLGTLPTAVATICAFVLFWPAILLPILDVERLGHHHTSSILTGTMHLFSEGSYFVALVVLLFSIVFPLCKILLLLELSVLGLSNRRHRARTYRLMEAVGKWSMMDVLLLALLVMLVKVGMLVEFEIGPAVLAFVMCVALSMIASLMFDPHGIWEDEPDQIANLPSVEGHPTA